jgi:glycosyltransferase involved in cell wall biosynthesis
MKHCLAIWNVSAAIADAREKHSHLKAKRYAPQIVVPLGIWYDRIPKIPHTKRQKGRIVFMGHLLEKQGLQKVIEAMPEVIKKIPKAHLVVIGSGDYEQKLKDLVVTKKLSSHVKFLGFIESHKKVEEELCKSTLAVATYVPDPKSFTYFADPGKIKNYLAAGLPVMLTDVPPIAKSIAKEKSAILCSYDSGDIAKKITDLLTDQNKLVNYSKNATNYAKQFDWNIVFKKALDSSLQ